MSWIIGIAAVGVILIKLLSLMIEAMPRATSAADEAVRARIHHRDQRRRAKWALRD